MAGGGKPESGTGGAQPAEPGAALSGRERILNQARQHFLKQGYAAVSMQQIADAAGVNKATLYHHFRDKEDLFVAVLASELQRIEAAIEAAVAAGETLPEQLERVAGAMLSPAGCDVGRLVSELKRHVAAERRAALRTGSPFPWEVMVPALAAAAARGELRADLDPPLLAELYFGMILSQIRRIQFDNGAPDPALPHLIVSVLLDGAAADVRGTGRSNTASGQAR